MVKFLKTKDYKVKDPVWDMPANAGIDGFVPSCTQAFLEAFSAKNPEVAFANGESPNNPTTSWFDTKNGVIHIAPHSDVLIPAGLYTQIPEGVALIDMNKSGVSTKKKLAVGACVIDLSYQGIVHYHVFNFSSKWVDDVKCDEKIVQMVPVLIDTTGASVEENIDPKEWFGKETARGAGGFGSTGLK